MTVGQVIDKFFKFKEQAVKMKGIEKPISYALYKTWKWADAYEKPRKEEEHE